MSTARHSSTLRRLLAASAVAGFLAGGPILLHWLGSPLPSRWPTWTRFVTDVRIGFVPSSAPGKVAIGAGWALWAFLGYELLAETWSRLRRRVGRPASALGPLQPLVSKLVAALLLSAPTAARSMPVGALPAPTSVPALATLFGPATLHLADSTAEIAETSAPVSTAGSSTTPPPVLPAYVVRPRDTLWGIAQRLLGDPLRWSEIARLNAGRLEGTSNFGDPHWIQPGWVLLLPADAHVSQAGVAADGAPTAPVAGSVDESPLPTETGPGLAIASGGPGPAPPVGVGRPAPGPPRITEGTTLRHQVVTHRRRAPVAPIGYGLLAAGVIGMLDRMRRAQQRRRPRGLHIRLPDGELSRVEGGLRATADMALGSAVDLTVRLVAKRVADGACDRPAIVAVRCGRDRIDLVHDMAGGPPAVPPEPFRLDGDVWSLDRQWLAELTVDGRRRLSELEAPLPGLVTLGGDAGTTVLVDVERMGSLAVTGSDATLVLQGMVVELATLPWADGAEVVVVGHPGELCSLDRVRQAPSIAGLLVEMQRRVAHQGALARQVGAGGTVDGRWRTGGDGWDPVVVVCLPAAADAEPEAAARLAELAGVGDRGVVLVVGAALATRWSASADRGAIALSGPSTGHSEERPEVPRPGDLEPLAVQPVPATLLDDVEALVATAGGAAVEPSPRIRSERAGPGPEDAMEPGHEVEVQVLGPVGVVGSARPFSTARAWSLELVVYLAMHPGGASTDQWATALWPDRMMAPASLHSTASAARRALGVAASGVDHLPRAHGRLALGPTVTSDWARLQLLAAADDPEQWAVALRLVRGRPFESLRAGDWAVLEGITAAIEAEVVDLATRYAQWCLEVGDPAGAEWAARRGLRVSAYDERLYRVLLKSADRAGNPAGVESAMQELVELVAEDVEPFDAVHPETWDLYRSLSRRARPRAGGDRRDQGPSSLARAR